MSAYILHLGRVSIGMGILCMLVPQEQSSGLRVLAATILLCVLFQPMLGDIESFSLPELPKVSSLAVQKEAEAEVRACYMDNLAAEVKKKAGAEARVFITLREDNSVDTVTVYNAQYVEGLRAYIKEKLAPQEVNIYGNEKEDA